MTARRAVRAIGAAAALAAILAGGPVLSSPREIAAARWPGDAQATFAPGLTTPSSSDLPARVALALGAPRPESIPNAPADFVTDSAGVLAPSTVRALDAKLAAYERQTGHQVVVWVGRSTGGVPIEDWAVRAFEKWEIGRKKADDGVLLAVFVEDRRARIEVGYGLEPKLTDLQANRILDEQVLPRMRAGDPNGAITAGVDGILAAIEGGAPPPAGPSSPDALSIHPTPVQIFGLIILGLLVLGILITHPQLALWLLWTIAGAQRRGGGGGWSRGGGGGWGGGGGGFRGGGGRSGGGGASGSW